MNIDRWLASVQQQFRIEYFKGKNKSEDNKIHPKNVLNSRHVANVKSFDNRNKMIYQTETCEILIFW